MGLIRKAMSVSTAGAVDFRSDKERTAKYTKKMAQEARKQTAILNAQTAQSQSPARSVTVRDLIAMRKASQAEQWSHGADESVVTEPDDLTTRLVKLGDLHRSGALTDAEFASAKAKLLG